MIAGWKHNSQNYTGWLSLLLGSFHEPANRGPCTMGVTHNRMRNKGATKFTWRQTLKQKKINNKKRWRWRSSKWSSFMVLYNNIRDRSSALGINPRANGRNIVGCYILCLFKHPVGNLWSGLILAVLIHSLLRRPLQSETKIEPDLRLPRCMFLRVTGSCCARFETSKTNTSKFQFDLERTDTFKRVYMNSCVLRG